MRNVNSCIQPHAENLWKTPKEVALHNARATIQNSANILGPQGNVTMIGASEYISRAQGESKPHLRLRYQVQLPELQINNKLWLPTKCGLQPPPTLVNTPYPACHHHSPCPLTNSLPHPAPMQYLTTPQTTIPLHPNLPPLHAIHYTTSSSSTPTQSLHPPLTSAPAPQTQYPSFSPIVIPPQSHTSITRMCTSKQHKGAQLRMSIIFFYGKWCTMYNNNNWTTWWQWWVQLQLPGANQLILNNKLQHPGTQLKETKAQSTIDIWTGK